MQFAVKRNRDISLGKEEKEVEAKINFTQCEPPARWVKS